MWHVGAHGRLHQTGSKNLLYKENTSPAPTKATELFLLIMYQYITIIYINIQNCYFKCLYTGMFVVLHCSHEYGCIFGCI